MNRQLPLLEYLAYILRLEYLSDLRNVHKFAPSLLSTLEAVPSDKYSLEEWNAALQYMFPQARPCDTPEQARTVLIKALEDGGRSAPVADSQWRRRQKDGSGVS